MVVKLLKWGTEMRNLLQLNRTMFNMRYPRIPSCLDFFPDLFSSYGLPPYEISRYLDLRNLKLFTVSN